MNSSNDADRRAGGSGGGKLRRYCGVRACQLSSRTRAASGLSTKGLVAAACLSTGGRHRDQLAIGGEFETASGLAWHTRSNGSGVSHRSQGMCSGEGASVIAPEPAGFQP